ncbi:hypothetical protein, partial [Salmonella enterica]|uniref:hypothetical protein n=1 Tax=Salmonella enterica TaxID=28901 RepID=UPI003D273CF8
FLDDGETDTPAVTDAPALAAALPADDPVCAATAIPFELPPWQPTLVLVWVGGSAGWFLLAGMRLLRFVRLLRYAVPASD